MTGTLDLLLVRGDVIARVCSAGRIVGDHAVDDVEFAPEIVDASAVGRVSGRVVVSDGAVDQRNVGENVIRKDCATLGSVVSRERCVRDGGRAAKIERSTNCVSGSLGRIVGKQAVGYRQRASTSRLKNCAALRNSGFAFAT